MEEKDRAMTFHASFKSDGAFKANFGSVERISTSDYEELFNKPSIEGNVLIGDKTYAELGLNEITPQEIDEILFGGE